jgi:outer membrane receptor for Fe3+-dicitrate
VTQDQRNSLRARVRFQAPRHAWLAIGAQYGSGLPADIGNAKVADLLAAFAQRILDRVDLARGRVRPNFFLDMAAGADIYHKEQRSAALQIQVANLANRLNVINFASLFSGTALGEPRSVSASLRMTF